MSIDKFIEQFLATQTRIAEALEAIAKQTPATSAPAPAETKPTTAKAAVEEAKAKAAEAKAAAAPAPAPAPTPEPEPDLMGGGEEEAAPVVLDFDKDIAPAFLAFSKAKGRDATVALLKQYGAANAKGVKVSDYPAFHAALTA